MEIKRHEKRIIKSKASNKDVSKQLLEALIYYGDVAEIPYSIECFEGEYEGLKSLLYEYFSRNKMLQPKKREERKAVFEKVMPLFPDMAAINKFLYDKPAVKDNFITTEDMLEE